MSDAKCVTKPELLRACLSQRRKHASKSRWRLLAVELCVWGEHRAAGVLRCNCPVALLLLGRLTARQVGVKCFSPPHVIPVPHLGSVEGRQSRCAATQACARVASPPTRQRRLVPGGQAVAVAVRSSRVRTALFPPVDAPSTLRRSRAPGRSQSQFPSSPTLPSAARPRAPWLAPR